jgi:hypothetical protein
VRDRDAPSGRLAACTATIVARRAALTAGHCLLIVSRRLRPRVVIGRQTLRGPALARPRVTGVSYPAGHARVGRRHWWDVALLWLDRPAPVAPVPLAGPGLPAPAAGQDALAIGWGITASGRQARRLRLATTPVASGPACRLAYGGRGPAIDDVRNLCAGSGRPRPVACRGDSGGPLMVATPAGWQDAGVASWRSTRHRCQSPRPTIYARVDRGPLRAWLDGALAAGRPAVPLGRFAAGRALGAVD